MSRHPRPSAELLRDPVDDFGLPDFPYQRLEAAPPPRPHAWDRWPVQALTAVGALVAGFLLIGALFAGRDVAVQQDARKEDLLALVELRQAHNDALSAQLDELRQRVSETEAHLTRQVPALAAQLETLKSGTGLTAVAGPGVRVTFTDGDPGCSERPNDCRIHDADLQLAVNTLFASGAEAVAINGERLIATTAIRSAGGSVLVNYRVLTSPYVVEAIGNPVGLPAQVSASHLATDFKIWRDTYGLGFGIEAVTGEGKDVLTVPAHSGSAQLPIAEVAAS